MALPGTFDPVRLEGRLLSDGGILNNVPVDVVRAMGMGVVIAVSVGDPEADRPAETIGAVANRAIDLMMQQLAEARLRDAEVVIRPDLDDFKSTDYRKSDDIAARGYAAAEALAPSLLRYALDDRAWMAHTNERSARRQPKTGPVSFVEVSGVSPAAAAQVARRFERDLAQASDPTAIEANLDWAIGQGRYASAMYERREKDGRSGLGIEIRDKSYAPPFVRFALDLNNESKDVNLALGSRITMMDVFGQGSEWRVDATVGSTLQLATELQKPLGGTGPLRRGAFLAPHLLYSRTSENRYRNDDLAAIYSRQSAGGGLDLGWHVGRTTEFRVGYDLAYVRNVTRVGDVLPRSRGEEQTAHLRFAYEGQDRAHLANRGARITASASWMVDGPDSSRAFGWAESTFDVAVRVADRHQFTFRATGGVSFGETLPLLYQFSLGGPFRLGASPSQAFRAPNFVLGSVGYRRPLKRLPSLLGDRLFVMGLVEVGSAFDRLSAARFETSFTGGLVADTFFGPFFVGGSVGRSGGVRAYFIVGSLVR
jgi:NTE family protein